MKNRKHLSHINAILKRIAIFLLLLSIAGCAQNMHTKVEAEEPAVLSEEPEEDYLMRLQENEDSRKSIEPKRVGVAMPTRTSERWINDGMNMKAKLETLGYEVDLQYADDDIELQVSQIENMIRNGANCLVISSIDSTRLTGILQEAKTAGIPVIAYDRLLMDTDAVSYYASFDNKAVGTLIGRYIERKCDLEKAYREGDSFTIEFFMGSPDDNNAIFLYDGAMEVLRPYLQNGTLICRSGKTSFQETCILRWSDERAKAMCLELLDAHYPEKDLDIICSAFDGFDYGILDACMGRGYQVSELPIITGQDAEKIAVRNITEGKQTMTIFKDSRILASKCVTMVQAVLEGDEPEINDTTQYNNNVLTVPSYLCDPIVVDRENYEELLIGGGYYTKEQLFSEE